MFGIIVFLVLSLGGLIAPALSATSVNGDRSAGVLATLQTTLLSPAEIAAGKLLGAWGTALALLAAASPFLLWGYLEGGTPIGRLAVTVALVALTLLVVCAIGLGWSAVAARTSSSVVLTYLTVAFLGLGLPLLFLLSLPTVTVSERVPVRQDNGNGCQAAIYQQTTRPHTERVWWLLALSPYVVVADAAPRPSSSIDDPLTLIRTGVREARLGPSAIEDWCFNGSDGEARAIQRESLAATWPLGLAGDLCIGGAFAAVTVRRLRAPVHRLPRGTRVA